MKLCDLVFSSGKSGWWVLPDYTKLLEHFSKKHAIERYAISVVGSVEVHLDLRQQLLIVVMGDEKRVSHFDPYNRGVRFWVIFKPEQSPHGVH